MCGGFHVYGRVKNCDCEIETKRGGLCGATGWMGWKMRSHKHEEPGTGAAVRYLFPLLQQGTQAHGGSSRETRTDTSPRHVVLGSTKKQVNLNQERGSFAMPLRVKGFDLLFLACIPTL